LETVKYFDSAIITKSGLMVGMGENENEILAVLKDLRTAGCQILTIGQYLPPSVSHFPLYDYVRPKLLTASKSLLLTKVF
jgi:lipoic acid synthetase